MTIICGILEDRGRSATIIVSISEWKVGSFVWSSNVRKSIHVGGPGTTAEGARAP